MPHEDRAFACCLNEALVLFTRYRCSIIRE